MKRDFLTLSDFSKSEIESVLARAIELKRLAKSGTCPKPFVGKTLALIFEKSSTRTRVSFEVAMNKLGGQCVYLNQDMSQLGRGESYADTARVLSRYVDGLVLRTYSHFSLTELARYATVSVINGLTDSYHPCQLMADMMTILEHKKTLQDMTIAYVGDGNNMTHSWIEAAHIMGFQLRVATPKDYACDQTVIAPYLQSPNILFTNDPLVAVKNVDVINTDTWFSMGQEVSEEKRQMFWPFQVNEQMLTHAKKDVIVMHCLPAHRGEEITDAIIDGSRSVVFDEAENRLYAQMAILETAI